MSDNFKFEGRKLSDSNWKLSDSNWKLSDSNWKLSDSNWKFFFIDPKSSNTVNDEKGTQEP